MPSALAADGFAYEPHQRIAGLLGTGLRAWLIAAACSVHLARGNGREADAWALLAPYCASPSFTAAGVQAKVWPAGMTPAARTRRIGKISRGQLPTEALPASRCVVTQVDYRLSRPAKTRKH